MANHKSAIKRIRQNNVRRLRNKYQYKTLRNAITKFKTLTNKGDAEKEYNRISAMVDKLAKKNVIHKNKAANQKSTLAKFVNTLS